MKEYIKIIGPYNSGTNLLYNLLHKNVINEDKNNITEISILQNNDMSLWKHSNNYDLITEYLDKYKNMKIIFMYKNYLSLINSMKKKNTISDFLIFIKTLLYFVETNH